MNTQWCDINEVLKKMWRHYWELPEGKKKEFAKVIYEVTEKFLRLHGMKSD